MNKKEGEENERFEKKILEELMKKYSQMGRKGFYNMMYEIKG